MSKTLLTISLKLLDQAGLFRPTFIAAKTISSKASEKKIAECSYVLNIPPNSKQDAVRGAFLNLAKKFHPDSGSPEADMDKFVAVEAAFRTLTEHNTGVIYKEEIEKIVHDIKAQKAAINATEHRLEKTVASDKTLIKKGGYRKKRNIKTMYGFERLAEDLIQESVSKGEFENLSGTGKPLKTQLENPYVDFMTQKLNEVLINNGFTPEWITLAKEIDQEIDSLKEEIRSDRMPIGSYPLSGADVPKWEKICERNRELASSINLKINKYNMIVPLLNKQKLHVEFDKICEDILKNGVHSVVKAENANVGKTEYVNSSDGVDLFGAFFKALGNLITFKEKKNS